MASTVRCRPTGWDARGSGWGLSADWRCVVTMRRISGGHSMATHFVKAWDSPVREDSVVERTGRKPISTPQAEATRLAERVPRVASPLRFVESNFRSLLLCAADHLSVVEATRSCATTIAERPSLLHWSGDVPSLASHTLEEPPLPHLAQVEPPPQPEPSQFHHWKEWLSHSSRRSARRRPSQRSPSPSWE